MIPTKTSTIGLFLRSYYEIGDVPVDGMFFGESAFAPILMLYVLDDHVAPVCAATAFHPASKADDSFSILGLTLNIQ